MGADWISLSCQPGRGSGSGVCAPGVSSPTRRAHRVPLSTFRVAG